MATYLQLCQTARELAGIPGTGPTHVTNQVGEMHRLCNWISQAWVEIQNQRDDWQWMRKLCSFDTVAQQQEYDITDDIGLTDFGHWKDDTFSIYLKAQGRGNETYLNQCEYDDFNLYYDFGTRATTYARPTTIAIGPTKNLLLGFAPDDEYTVRGEYFTSPQILAADSDVPDLPSRFHMIIVHRALMKFGTFTAAPEVLQEQDALYRILLNKVEQDQTPRVSIGGSLI